MHMICLRHQSSGTFGLHAVLAPLIQEHAAPERLLPTATDSAFHALAHVIMGQQLSVASARNIAQKVKDACGVSCPALSTALEQLWAMMFIAQTHSWDMCEYSCAHQCVLWGK